MARWMGDPSHPRCLAGTISWSARTMRPGEDRVRRCVIFGKGVQQASLSTDAQWIIPTGGGYFFVPSISAMLEVIGK